MIAMSLPGACPLPSLACLLQLFQSGAFHGQNEHGAASDDPGLNFHGAPQRENSFHLLDERGLVQALRQEEAYQSGISKGRVFDSVSRDAPVARYDNPFAFGA